MAEEGVYSVQNARVPTVLVVEDEILVRTMIADRLREAGYGVIEASTADEALSLLRSGLTGVDVVLTDVRMPGTLDGIGLAQLVRSELPAVKIILASGHLPDSNALEHDGFFPKPYDVRQVVGHIRKLTRHRNA